MTTTNYKGILVAAGLIGAATLWFARSDKAHVQAIDPAEIAAATVDCANEYLSGLPTNWAGLFGLPDNGWWCRTWEIDNTVTQSWGGYESFDILTPDGGTMAPIDTGFGFYVMPAYGHYVFHKRYYYPQQPESPFYFQPSTYDCADIYTNTLTLIDSYGNTNISFIVDFGPSGAPISYTGPWSVYFSGFFSNMPNGSFTFAWQPITTNRAYSFYSYEWQVYTDAGGYSTNNGSYTQPYLFTNEVASTSTPSRVRHYSPHRLKSLRNTISTTFDASAINFIRPALMSMLLGQYTAIYKQGAWIGPVDSTANYDGVTNFPTTYSAVETTLTNWAEVYGVWATNGYAVVLPPATNTVLNYDSYPVIVTNQVVTVRTNWIANQGVFIKTNELAWHYSALYRLRDSIPWQYGAVSNRSYYKQYGSITSYADAWSVITADFAANPNGNGGSAYPNVPHCFISKYRSGRFYFYDVDFAQVEFAPPELYTNILHKIEFYAKAQGWDQYDAQGETIISTNAWRLYDTSSTISGVATSAMYGSFILPIESSGVEGTAVNQIRVGWRADVTPVIRWQQRACTNAIFDNRYP